MSSDTIIVALIGAFVGSLGTILTNLITVRKDRNLDRSAIVGEYRDLIEAHRKELERLTARVTSLEEQLVREQAKVQEMEARCVVCKTSVRVKAKSANSIAAI